MNVDCVHVFFLNIGLPKKYKKHGALRKKEATEVLKLLFQNQIKKSLFRQKNLINFKDY